MLTTCCVFALCVVRKRSASWSTAQSWAFLAPEWTVQVQRWSPSASTLNFRQPQTTSGFSAITGIWSPMEMEKNVCQRLGDQDSSWRWGLICPSQPIGFKKRTRLGASSSWDSRSVISVLRTDSSIVATMRCCERELNCSWRRVPTNLSLRSQKGCQWSRICLVTLSWEGMAATPALEAEDIIYYEDESSAMKINKQKRCVLVHLRHQNERSSFSFFPSGNVPTSCKLQMQVHPWRGIVAINYLCGGG